MDREQLLETIRRVFFAPGHVPTADMPDVLADAILALSAWQDTHAAGFVAGIEAAAQACDALADATAYSADPMIAGVHDGCRKCARAVRALTPAQAPGAWHDIGTSLPPDGTRCLVWIDLAGLHVTDRSYADIACFGPTGFTRGHGGHPIANITHWQKFSLPTRHKTGPQTQSPTPQEG